MTDPADFRTGFTGDPAGFTFLHQPFWCEENAWHLSAHTAFATHEVVVAMVTGPQAGWNVRCRCQRAGGPRGVLDWDYHVVVFTRDVLIVDGGGDAGGDAGGAGRAESLAASSPWRTWDPDSTLPFPTTAAAWLDETFLPAAPHWLSPFFRVFSGAEYRRVFSSDRLHKRTGDRWHKPPPPWPAIGDGPANLFDLLDPQRPGPGEVLDLATLRARLAGRA